MGGGMVGMKEGRFKNSFREFGNNGYKCLSVVASLSRPEYQTSVVLTRQAEHLLSHSECACLCACVLCVCGGGALQRKALPSQTCFIAWWAAPF